ncbi:lysoplasmalogenase [Agromyces salentinus]|uniref:Lysoplasmalogenase n=1 Tax=Agromyces salentinus TaxID=269421 RepID=A0ABN2MZC3_9MICO|nr:lysoplasmalogenase [Agromyces salentinus]
MPKTFTPYLVLCAVHLVLLETGPEPAVTWTKALLMPLLALGVVFACRSSGTRAPVLLLLAIGFSWAGDVALSFPGLFVVGLCGFLLAHLAYITVFLRVPGERMPGERRRPPLWTLVYAAWFVGFLALLGPHTGALLVPAAAYGLVLGLMAAFAASRGTVMAVGGALFVVSDTVLGLGRFLPGYAFAPHDLVVMSTYLAAQLLISLGVLAALRASARSSSAPGRPAAATAP